MPNIEYFTPDTGVGSVNASVTSALAVVALPNASAPLVYLSNVGPSTLFFKLGASNAVKTLPSTGMILNSGNSLIVGSTGMAYIALIASDSQVTQAYITSGS